MKKTYISPASKVVKVGVAQIMAASPGVTMNSGGSVNAANVEVHENNGWDIWSNEDASE